MNTDTVMNTAANASVAVKVIRGNEMRRFQFNGKSFEELKAVISQIFSIAVDDFILQYEDDERDRVTLSTDAELNEAIKLHKYVLRFYVLITKPVVPPSPSGAAAAAHVPGTFPHHPHFHHAPMMTADGEVTDYRQHHHVMRGCGRGGRGRHGGFPGHGGHFHHGEHPYAHKKFIKEEKEALRQEKKRLRKERKYESSSSSSSEDEQKIKERKQLIKAIKKQIRMNWAITKQANPAQWPENRKLMRAEIQAAKRAILQQNDLPVNVPVEQPVASPAEIGRAHV